MCDKITGDGLTKKTLNVVIAGVGVGKSELIEKPYLEEVQTVIIRHYNPNYGDERLCQCGHTYWRHFDTYEDMYPIGCKYCDCDTFVEKTE